MSSNLIYSPSAARVLNSIPSNEHTAGDRTPYCYLIGWTKQNLWYYGRRTAKGCHPSEFWKKYKTSSLHVDAVVEAYGDPDTLQIRKVFIDIESCKHWENCVLTRLDVESRADFINRRNGDSQYDSTGLVNATLKSTGESFLISCDEFRNNRSLYSHHADEMVIAIDSTGKSMYVSVHDQRYKSGEVKQMLQTGIQLISPDGKMFVCPREDEHLYPDHKRNLEGTVFAEDSNGNIHKVSTDDVRLITGELTCLAEGKVAVIDSNGNSYRVDCEEYHANKGTKYVTATTGTVPVRLPNGEFTRVKRDDPRYLSGEFVSINLGMTIVIDPTTGKRAKVNIDDERIKSGELIKSNYDKEKHNGRIDKNAIHV